LILGKTTDTNQVEPTKIDVMRIFSFLVNVSFLSTSMTNYCLVGLKETGKATNIEQTTARMAMRPA
jgi:hypothetical protein